MRLRIHHPLFAGFLGVIGMLVVLVVVLTGRGFRRELTETNRSAIQRELLLAVSLAAALPPSEPQDVARRITGLIGHRVTLIAGDGRVLGDSDVRADRLGGVPNQLGRPEVSAALDGQVYVEAADADGTPVVYGARRVLLGDEVAVLRIA